MFLSDDGGRYVVVPFVAWKDGGVAFSGALPHPIKGLFEMALTMIFDDKVRVINKLVRDSLANEARKS